MTFHTLRIQSMYRLQLLDHPDRATLLKHSGTWSNKSFKIKDNLNLLLFRIFQLNKKILSKINPAVIFDLEKYHTGAFNKYNDHKNKFLFDVIVNNLNRGKQEGLYRKDININLIARFRLASMFLIFNPEIFPGEHFNLPQLIAETTDNFLYGIASEEGRLMIEHYKQLSKNLIPA